MKLWHGQPDNWKPSPPSRGNQLALGIVMAAFFGYLAFTDYNAAADVCSTGGRWCSFASWLASSMGITRNVAMGHIHVGWAVFAILAGLVPWQPKA